MRLFVAVVVEPTVGDRTSSPSPEHVTLRFLGEQPESCVGRLVELLAPIGARVGPFEFVLEGVGAFPSAERPRVVWQGVTVGRDELALLAREVRDTLRADFGDERETFVPHLTLFRVRSTSDQRAARELLYGERPVPPIRRVGVREFVLKESVLGARGAVHRTVAAFPLGATAGRAR